MRDPTRGGQRRVLSDLAEKTGLTIEVEESAVPISPVCKAHLARTASASIRFVANEGKIVLVTAAPAADAVLAAVRATPYGRDARRIGFVTAAHPGRVALRAAFGTRRVLDMPVGELLPRIC